MITLKNLVNEALNGPERSFITQLNNERVIPLSCLKENISLLSKELKSNGLDIEGQLIGIAMRTSFQWIVSDLTILLNEGVSLPVPLDFSDEQIFSLLNKANYCIVDTIQAVDRLRRIFPEMTLVSPEGAILSQGYINKKAAFNYKKDGIIKIIHTSGTTSSPKGVIILDAAMGVLLQNLFRTILPGKPIHYLSLLPMSLLVEQVFSIYMPLISHGSTCLIPSSMPEFGTQLDDTRSYLKLIQEAKPNFVYFPPKLLESVVSLVSTMPLNKIFPDPIPHIITGGTKVSKALLERLSQIGLPVFEGYGMSENSSVISMNMVEQHRLGSVGKLLPGIDAVIKDKELCIKSETLCGGYYCEDNTSCDYDDEGYLHTGDIAKFDADGYLYITGRKKNVIILSSTRNVSPEWVESIIKAFDCIDEVVVLGDGLDSLGAVLIIKKDAEEPNVISILKESNKKLPSFARISCFYKIKNDSQFRERYYTVTGRPKRSEIFRDYKLQVFAHGEKVV